MIVLSVYEGDPGYEAWSTLRDLGYVPHVTLDGAEVRHVTRCNVGEGWVQYHPLTNDGKPVVDHKAGELVFVRKYGKVEVELRRAE